MMPKSPWTQKKITMANYNSIADYVNLFQSFVDTRTSYSGSDVINGGIIDRAVRNSYDLVVAAASSFDVQLRTYPTCFDIGVADSNVLCRTANLTILSNSILTVLADIHHVFYEMEYWPSRVQQYHNLHLVLSTLILKVTTTVDTLTNNPQLIYGSNVKGSIFRRAPFSLDLVQSKARILSAQLDTFKAILAQTNIADNVAANTVTPLSSLITLYNNTVEINARINAAFQIILNRLVQPDTIQQSQDDSMYRIVVVITVSTIMLVLVYIYTVCGIGVRLPKSLLTPTQFLTYSIFVLGVMITIMVLIAFIARQFILTDQDATRKLYAASVQFTNASLQWRSLRDTQLMMIFGILQVDSATELPPDDVQTMVSQEVITPLTSFNRPKALNFSLVLTDHLNTLTNVEVLYKSLYFLKSRYSFDNTSVQVRDQMMALVYKKLPFYMEQLSTSCIYPVKYLDKVPYNSHVLDVCTAANDVAQQALVYVLGPSSWRQTSSTNLADYNGVLNSQLGALNKYVANDATIATTVSILQGLSANFVVPLMDLISRSQKQTAIGLQIEDQVSFLSKYVQQRATFGVNVLQITNEYSDDLWLRFSVKRRLATWLTVFTLWGVQIIVYYLWRCMFPAVM
eukprot:PhF_6_TR37145/c0_g1_i1/m.54672